MHTHAKIVHTKEKLYKALNILIEKKDLSDITVTEICENANVNRSTFYRYYSLPKDILDEQVNIILDNALIHFSKHYSNDSIEDIRKKMLEFSQIYYENRYLTRLYNDLSKKTYLYLKHFLQNTSVHNVEELEENILFISGGLISIFNEWAVTGFKSSPQHIAETLTRLISRFA